MAYRSLSRDTKEGSKPKNVGKILFVFYTIMLFVLLLFIVAVVIRSHGHSSGFHSSPMFRYFAFNFRDDGPQLGYCPPAVNVFFLKTHKCASSTVQNILMRFGDERNLSFILPEESNYIGHPEKFSRSMIVDQLYSYPDFNILCHHLRFNVQEIQNVLSPKTYYISILRNPVSLFGSMYDYYNMQNIFNRTLSNFLMDENLMKKLNSERIYEKLGRNQMLFDFGYDKAIWENTSLIQSAINEIDARFDLIMISELFDESLILLKHMLCWSTADIVHLKHNMRKIINEEKNESIALKIKNYNSADKLLYDHFYKRLLKHIETFGKERMTREVEDLRLWNSLWFNHCIKKMTSENKEIPSETKAYNSKVYSFVLNDGPTAEICKRLAMEELQYTEKLRVKQKTIFGIFN